MKVKFSIITVCYNSEKTLERTIKSILAQTYQDFEYVLVDGGSKDGTLDIIRKYEDAFGGRLKWKSEPDKGIYNAMNKGISRATGDVIGIVNSDDWLGSTALESVMNCIEKEKPQGAYLVCGSIAFHYEDGKSDVWESDRERFMAGIPRRSYNYGAYHPAIFVSKEAYEKVGVFDEQFKIVGDIEFIYRCYVEKCQFLFTKDVLSNMSDGGISNSFQFKKTFDDNKRFMKKHHVTGVPYYYNMARILIKSSIKTILPEKLLKQIRSKRQS